MVSLERGTLAHRRIAKRATRIRSLERARFLVLLLVFALAVGVIAQLMSVGSVLRP